MNGKDLPRLAVTAGVFALLAFVLWHNSDNEMLIGALIGAFGTAITFWLGSSKGSADKSDQIERMEEGPSGTREDPMVIEGAPEGSEAVTTKPRGKFGG